MSILQFNYQITAAKYLFIQTKPKQEKPNNEDKTRRQKLITFREENEQSIYIYTKPQISNLKSIVRRFFTKPINFKLILPPSTYRNHLTLARKYNKPVRKIIKSSYLKFKRLDSLKTIAQCMKNLFRLDNIQILRHLTRQYRMTEEYVTKIWPRFTATPSAQSTLQRTNISTMCTSETPSRGRTRAAATDTSCTPTPSSRRQTSPHIPWSASTPLAATSKTTPWSNTAAASVATCWKRPSSSCRHTSPNKIQKKLFVSTVRRGGTIFPY